MVPGRDGLNVPGVIHDRDTSPYSLAEEIEPELPERNYNSQSQST